MSLPIVLITGQLLTDAVWQPLLDAWPDIERQPYPVAKNETDGALAVSVAAERGARAILLAGIYELDRRNDVPARVVIAQYVDVAQQFFSGGEPAFVNVTLDRVAHRLRPTEFETPVSKAATPDGG